MEQNDELRQAWDFVEHTGISIFLTGKAGTGKTTFLKTLRERSSKQMIVVAPTGVAALNADGVTIHSFFQLPLSPFLPGMKTESRFKFSREKRRIINSLDLLVIDEISMVRSDLLDAVDSVLRRYRQSTRPFGGVQLLMIGDLQQLTPVVRHSEEAMLSRYYDTPYFFGSQALKQIRYVTIELHHVYRQQDAHFITILNHVRDAKATMTDLQELNGHYKPLFRPKPEDGFIRLTTHNAIANDFNANELRSLKTPSFCYEAEVYENFPEADYPTEMKLELKVGAQVMFVKNDTNHQFYNGRIGQVVALDENSVSVKCPEDTETINVQPAEWENTKFSINERTKSIEREVVGTFRQIPLRLAWAITIHKSQGLTFAHAIIDAKLSFAPGQVYVALSRCQNLEGLVLSSPIAPGAIMNDYRVDDYISHQNEAAQKSIAQLPALKDEYYKDALVELFSFNNLDSQEKALLRILQEYFPQRDDLQFAHQKALAQFQEEVLEVSAKWTALILQSSLETLRSTEFLERVRNSALYFGDKLKAVFGDLLERTRETECSNKTGKLRFEDAMPQLMQTFKAKIYLLGDMEEENFCLATFMKLRQTAKLDAMDNKAHKRRKSKDKDDSGEEAEQETPKKQKGNKKEKREKKERIDTKQVSLDMLNSGMDVTEITNERGLQRQTVIKHLSHFIAEGKLEPDGLITPEKTSIILDACDRAEDKTLLHSIKELCPENISYDEIILALAIKKRQDSQSSGE